MWSREAPPLGQEPPGGPTWGLLGAPVTPEELQRVRNHSWAQPGPVQNQNPGDQPRSPSTSSNLLPSGTGPAGSGPTLDLQDLSPDLLLDGLSLWSHLAASLLRRTRQNKVLPVVGQIKAALFQSLSPSAASCGPAVLSSRSSGRQSSWTPAFCAQPGELYSGLRPLLTSRRAPRHRESRPSSN